MSLKVLLLLCLTSLCLGRPNPCSEMGSKCYAAKGKKQFLNRDNFYLENIFSAQPLRQSSGIAATQQRINTYNIGGYKRYQSGNPYNQNYRQTRRGYYRQPSRRYNRYSDPFKNFPFN